MSRVARAIVLVTIALGAIALDGGVALAQSTGVVADRFVPGIGPGVILGGEVAEVTPPGRVIFGVTLGVARDPIRLEEKFTGALLSRPVAWSLASDVSAEFGIARHLALAVGVPVVWWQSGDRLRGTGAGDRALASTLVGDIRLRAKATLIGEGMRPGVHAAILAQLTIPGGGQSDFVATDGVTFEPRIILDYRSAIGALSGQVGVRFQRDRKLFDTTFGDELTWNLGIVSRSLNEKFLLLAFLLEAGGSVGGDARARPVEMRGGVRLSWRGVDVDLGAGGALVSAVGAPAWRLFLTVRGIAALRR